MVPKPLIQTRGLSKAYHGVLALDSVDFDLMSGEIHVLFGENGAGKSTFILLLSGALMPNAGHVELAGDTVHFESVMDAQEKGIYTVFQELSLIPTLSVAQNIFLGSEPRKGPFIDYSAMYKSTRELFKKLEFDIDPKELVHHLSRGEQQMVEIAKALRGDISILILDEPTASLTEHEVASLFTLITTLKSQGVGIIYISHRMQEFARIADRVTVLRDGVKIDTVAMKDTDEDSLVKMMTGRVITKIYPSIKKSQGGVVLQVANLKAKGVDDCSFTVRAGEVLGVAGLIGSGKSRLFRTVMGLQKRLGGTVTLAGRDISEASTREIINSGMHYLSPDRKNEGLDLAKVSHDNFALNLLMGRYANTNHFIDWKEIGREFTSLANYVDLASEYRDKFVSQLSGGNQQKVLFGKSLGHDVQVYIFDEPTVGVDVGTRSALYELIKQLAESGKAVVVISSDLTEVIHISHRLLVITHGAVNAELQGDDKTEEGVLQFFFNK